MMPKVTVITTSYQASENIRSTIVSVLRQDFDDFEYIIQDGGSSDGTLDIAGSYNKAFAEKGIAFHCFCEKDHGIYEGMNNAVRHASGSFINFMNAGDTFIDRHVLSHLFADNRYTDSDILFGDAVEYEYGRYYFFPKNPDNIRNSMPFSHQSVFARRDLLRLHPFNVSYKIAADYDFLLTALDDNCTFTDCRMPVCVITKDGLSTVDLYHTFIETVTVQRSHGIERFTPEKFRSKCRSAKIRQFGMLHFPSFLKCLIRRFQRHIRHQNEQVPAIMLQDLCL